MSPAVRKVAFVENVTRDMIWNEVKESHDLECLLINRLMIPLVDLLFVTFVANSFLAGCHGVVVRRQKNLC